MPLTAPQQDFCRQFIACKFNGSQAYRKVFKVKDEASARSGAARLLANVNVAARVKELTDQAAAHADVTPAMVLRELKFIAFQRNSQVYRADGALKSPAEWDEATDASISGLETEEEVEVVGSEEGREPQGHGGWLKRKRGAKVATRTVKVKRWSKEKALELFMKHFGMLKADETHPQDKKDLLEGVGEKDRAGLFAFIVGRK